MSAEERQPFRQFSYRASPDQLVGASARHQVVIVGAGPVGLSLAIDLAQRGVPSVVLDDNDRIGEGSRAICFSKRTLEIWDRLGVGEAAIKKGVQWRKGRVFHRDRQLYEFDLLPEAGHKMPAFINLQQYYIEDLLVDRAVAHGTVDLRWKNRVVGITMSEDGARLTIETPDGDYKLDANWVIACDGARSPLRSMLGKEFEGEQFDDQFLIADVKMSAAFPTERWFWFDPAFHDGLSALLHKQPDNVWRIDLQLLPTADPEHEKQPHVVRSRIANMIGHTDFELEWVSVYRFQCRRMKRFVHGRVIFAGDAAHQVAPFGARGANSGVQDAENLAWKLAAVVLGNSPSSLIETYNSERVQAADENIMMSTRATDFIAPRSQAERTLRDAALALATRTEFAKRLVNSGRLSEPTNYRVSRLSTADTDVWGGGPCPGGAMPDVPLTRRNGDQVYLTEIIGAAEALIVFGSPISTNEPITQVSIGPTCDYVDGKGLAAERFAVDQDGAYLIRPDRHVAARWLRPDAKAIANAVRRMRGNDGEAH
jgi:3-(3-hydroxy-phenyl)propionate hydroxylase